MKYAPGLLHFETLKIGDKDNMAVIKRAKVPGGWLVVSHFFTSFASFKDASVAFYPDPNHEWDGGSLPDETEADVPEVEEGPNPFYPGIKSK